MVASNSSLFAARRPAPAFIPGLVALAALAGLGAACAPSVAAPVGAATSPLVAGPPGPNGVFRDQVDATAFQRGNVHTHSDESDGDSEPENVYAWYRDHGYNFLALSDHSKRTDPDDYREVERPGFVIIPAEEITLKAGRKPVHVNAICHKRRIGHKRMGTVEEALRWAVERTRQEGGVSLVNHPNFHWAFGAEEIKVAAGATLLEIWSGHPKVQAAGDAQHPSVESMWDAVLSQGMYIGPAAVDDMHNLGEERDWRKAGPGRGWIDVFAQQANEAEICDAFRRGAFLASNGVRLARLTVRGDAFSVTTGAPGGMVEFIGQGGRVLAQQQADPAGRQPNTYQLRGGEGYVRARITAPNGKQAWTHAYRVQM